MGASSVVGRGVSPAVIGSSAAGTPEERISSSSSSSSSGDASPCRFFNQSAASSSSSSVSSSNPKPASQSIDASSSFFFSIISGFFSGGGGGGVGEDSSVSSFSSPLRAFFNQAGRADSSSEVAFAVGFCPELIRLPPPSSSLVLWRRRWLQCSQLSKEAGFVSPQTGHLMVSIIYPHTVYLNRLKRVCL